MQHVSGTPGTAQPSAAAWGPAHVLCVCCAPGCSGNSWRTAAHDVSWYILAPDSGIFGKIAVFEVIKGMEKKTWKFDKGLTYYIEKK